MIPAEVGAAIILALLAGDATASMDMRSIAALFGRDSALGWTVVAVAIAAGAVVRVLFIVGAPRQLVVEPGRLIARCIAGAAVAGGIGALLGRLWIDSAEAYLVTVFALSLVGASLTQALVRRSDGIADATVVRISDAMLGVAEDWIAGLRRPRGVAPPAPAVPGVDGTEPET